MADRPGPRIAGCGAVTAERLAGQHGASRSPAQIVGGASGLFSTAQQFGGAVGIAILGTIFFGHTAHHSLTAVFTYILPVTVVLAALASLTLPRTAVVGTGE